ncbi:DEAD/DEAH box helicase family protein [Loktanella sp. S4079]|uniref:DEAD/DEAH box helicase family protein n=1 Tax=Loktanella sp. S4079 TaxID=579483 RepID=UPI000B271FCA|nr:DEAD/DEAH box helicase family protein [Loktanella sp. S4079]
MTVTESEKTNETHTYFGNLSSLPLETEYRTTKDDPVGHFYARCLRNSGLYERAVGYFSSSVFHVVGAPVQEFALKGGKIRLICSPSLSPEDIEAIAGGYADRDKVISDALKKDIDRLIADENTNPNTRILSTLIACGTLDIKLATPKVGRGIYHEKLGVFSDTLGHHVSFRGSTNETWNGWHDDGNFETIEVFCSWRGGLEEERVNKHLNHFHSMWSGEYTDLDVIPFPSSVREYLDKFSLGSLKDLRTVEANPPSEKRDRDPLEHQKLAVLRWKQQSCRGIFEHATGTGKTFTAILAIKEHVLTGNPALILVPSKLLHGQWHEEIVSEIPEATILLAGSGNTKWKQTGRLAAMCAPDTSLGARVVIATMKTASSAQFRALVGSGANLLIVADEVHQIGSPQNSKCLEINAECRLGLSATPKRFGDPEGTSKIFNYFGPVVPPAISLTDAIKMDRLVPYEYFPHPVNLSASEADEWREYTRRIRNEMARLKADETGHKVLTERVKMLLIQRSRIAKKATAKVDLAQRVVLSEYAEGQSWLVYCEDSEQLAEVIDSLRSNGMSPIEYHSNMSGDGEATLEWFRKYGGVLVSIKCLDEGVDIPAVSHALILASSQNPRQFIQRRGRVLRKSDHKYMAVVHDAIVVPVDPESEPDQLSLLSSELVRSVEFAANSINRSASAELREIAIRMQIDVDGLLSLEGIEEDDDS